jgi:hypothetical protein
MMSESGVCVGFVPLPLVVRFSLSFWLGSIWLLPDGSLLRLSPRLCPFNLSW